MHTKRDRKRRFAKMLTVLIWRVGRLWLTSIPLCFSLIFKLSSVRIFCHFVLTKQIYYYKFKAHCFRICPQNEMKKKNKSEYTNFSIKETTFRINKSELTEHYYHVPGTFLSTSNVLTYLNQKRCIKRAWTTVNFSISIAWNEGIY